MPGRQQRRGIEAYDRYVQFSQVPVTALAFLMIPVLLIPLVRPVHGVVAVSFDAADYAIWALFAADYGVRFTLAPDRLRFVRTHLFDLAVVVLPFLRPLQALRPLRVHRLVLRGAGPGPPGGGAHGRDPHRAAPARGQARGCGAPVRGYARRPARFPGHAGIT